MIKPFEILREDLGNEGTLVLYKVSKIKVADNGNATKTSVTSTIFVETGLDTEEELVKNLIEGGWL